MMSTGQTRAPSGRDRGRGRGTGGREGKSGCRRRGRVARANLRSRGCRECESTGPTRSVKSRDSGGAEEERARSGTTGTAEAAAAAAATRPGQAMAGLLHARGAGWWHGWIPTLPFAHSAFAVVAPYHIHLAIGSEKVLVLPVGSGFSCVDWVGRAAAQGARSKERREDGTDP